MKLGGDLAHASSVASCYPGLNLLPQIRHFALNRGRGTRIGPQRQVQRFHRDRARTPRAPAAPRSTDVRSLQRPRMRLRPGAGRVLPHPFAPR